MQKSTLIAMLMLGGAMASYAAAPEGATFYWYNPEASDEYVAEAGTIEYQGGDSPGRLNYSNTALDVLYKTICLNGKKGNIDDFDGSANAGHMLVTPTAALKEGDVITMSAYRNKNAESGSSAYIVFSNGATVTIGGADGFGFVNLHVDGDTPDATEPNTLTYTITAAEAGSTSFRMTRDKASTNLFVTKVMVAPEGAGEPSTPEVDADAVVIPTTDPAGIDLLKAKIENNSPFSPSVKDNGDFYNLDYFGEGDVAVFKLYSSIATAYDITFESATPQEACNLDFIILDADGNPIYNENVFVPKTGETGGDWGNYETVNWLPATPALGVGYYTLRIVYHQGILWDTFTTNVRNIQFKQAAGVNDIINEAFAGKIYNINGIEVDENYKGFVIKNGKKYFQR